MRISASALGIARDPNLIEFIKAVANNHSRSQVAAVTPITLVDSSTGTAGSAMVPVPTQDVKGVASGSNMAPRAAFNTAIGKVNNAIAVLATQLNNVGLTPLQETVMLTGFTGTVATPGTVPAQDKTLTASDGSADSAMLRTEFNAAIVRARNNLATIVRAANRLATALGVANIKNNTLGQMSQTLVIGAPVTATTVVLTSALATTDVATKAAADAALTALANDIAFVMAKFANPIFSSANTLTKRVPITLVS